MKKDVLVLAILGAILLMAEITVPWFHSVVLGGVFTLAYFIRKSEARRIYERE